MGIREMQLNGVLMVDFWPEKHYATPGTLRPCRHAGADARERNTGLVGCLGCIWRSRQLG